MFDLYENGEFVKKTSLSEIEKFCQNLQEFDEDEYSKKERAGWLILHKDLQETIEPVKDEFIAVQINLHLKDIKAFVYNLTVDKVTGADGITVAVIDEYIWEFKGNKIFFHVNKPR